MKTKLMIALVLASLGSAARAADEDPNRDDVKCVLAMTAMLKLPQYAQAGATGLFYFVGRIEGRTPGYDLEHALRKVGADMQRNDYATEMQRCGAALGAKNAELKAMTPQAPKRGVGN